MYGPEFLVNVFEGYAIYGAALVAALVAVVAFALIVDEALQ